jgi:hypothetical protein
MTVGIDWRRSSTALGLVFGLDLETNAADKVRYLPIEPDQVFVPKKHVDSRALKHGPNDNSLGEIAISGYRDEIPQFGWIRPSVRPCKPKIEQPEITNERDNMRADLDPAVNPTVNVLYQALSTLMAVQTVSRAEVLELVNRFLDRWYGMIDLK